MNELRAAFLTMWRQPLRASFTLLSVAVAVFLYVAVTSLDRGMSKMLATSARPDVLVVFDRTRSCPPLSRLPEAHRGTLEDMPNVAEVTSELFVVSSCSRATDLVAVRGIEPGNFREFRSIEIPEADYRAFAGERGAALIGSRLAERVGWKPGQTVSVARLNGLTFTVRGIFRAPGDTLDEAILVDRGFLQQATGRVGSVTHYLVRVADASGIGALAERVERTFSGSAAPVRAAVEQNFLEAAVSGLSGLVSFSAALAGGALGLVVIGVGNSLSLGIRDRAREMAIRKVVGFRRPQVFRLLLTEAALSGFLGGALGTLAAGLALRLSHFSLSVEGFTFSPDFSMPLALGALGLATGLALIAGIPPAAGVARRPVVEALRDVS